MAQSGEAITPFLNEGLQPFEEALNLRRKTPSPKPDGADSPTVYTPGMSTRELQALYRKSAALASPPPRLSNGCDSSSTSFEANSLSTDEELQSPQAIFSERPLDTIRRQSASYDSLPVLKAPRRTTGPDTDPVFGLDIRDAFGWRFEESTPYDVLLPAPTISQRPVSLEPRRNSTPSLSSASSPATSSATTSTLSSITTPGATYASEYGLAKRRVSSMGDVPSLASVPSPQPIPLGKSRMNNELSYESAPEGAKRTFSSFWGRSAGKHKNVVKNPNLPAAIRKASDPLAKEDVIKSRTALSLPKMGKQKTPSPSSSPGLPEPPVPAKPPAKERQEKPRIDGARGRSALAVKSVLTKPKHSMSPAVRPSPPSGLAPEPARMAPALPIASAMSKTSLIISEASADPRLGKRQSADLLYKERSISPPTAADRTELALKTGLVDASNALHYITQRSSIDESGPLAPPTSPERSVSQKSRSRSARSGRE